MFPTASLTPSRRMFAFAAMIAVAGPGLVFADGGNPSYPIPESAVLVGPDHVSPTFTANYRLNVRFSDHSTAQFISPTATFTAQKGSFSGNVYMAPAIQGKDVLTGTYQQGTVQVVANKLVTNARQVSDFHLLGPDFVNVGDTVTYKMQVLFTDGTSTVYTYPQATFTASNKSGTGSFSGGRYSALTAGTVFVNGKVVVSDPDFGFSVSDGKDVQNQE